MNFHVSIPGGQVVAGFVTETLAREFVAWLGEQYADRAKLTMPALDEIADAACVRGRDAVDARAS